MKQKKHKPDEVIRLLGDCDSSQKSQESFCREKQISITTLHRCKRKYGQMDEADAEADSEIRAMC